MYIICLISFSSSIFNILKCDLSIDKKGLLNLYTLLVSLGAFIMMYEMFLCVLLTSTRLSVHLDYYYGDYSYPDVVVDGTLDAKDDETLLPNSTVPDLESTPKHTPQPVIGDCKKLFYTFWLIIFLRCSSFFVRTISRCGS